MCAFFFSKEHMRSNLFFTKREYHIKLACSFGQSADIPYKPKITFNLPRWIMKSGGLARGQITKLRSADLGACWREAALGVDAGVGLCGGRAKGLLTLRADGWACWPRCPTLRPLYILRI